MAHSQLACPLVLLCSLLMLPSVLMLEGGVPGGRKTISLTDETMQQGVAFAIENYIQRTDCPFCFIILRILEADVQAVSDGFIYDFTVKLGTTICDKRESLPSREIQNCPFPLMEEPEILICYIEAWSHYFLRGIEVRTMRCSLFETNKGKRP